MLPFLTQAEARPVPEPSDAAEVLDRMGLTTTLPERLMQDTTGRPFEPAQLSESGDLMAHLTLLLRREPLGGAEPQIRDNQLQAQEHVLPTLNRALAGCTSSTRGLLEALVQEARVRIDRAERVGAQVDERFRVTQQRLQRWQEQAGERSGSLGADLWRWLVGGADRLSLPDVVALWNEREHLSLQRLAHRAALDTCIFALNIMRDLLINLDAMIAQTRQSLTATQQAVAVLQEPTTVYQPWTLRVDPLVVANALADQADRESLLTDFLRRLAEHDGSALDVLMQAVASAEAQRLVQRQTLAEMITLDVSAGNNVDGDPLILVGQGLLDALNHPTWQIARSARLRSETIQITPDGVPLYSLDGLTTAAYGGMGDRLGFVQIQIGGALDDLLPHDGDASFQSLLRQRNLYVLDDLAQAAEAMAEPVSTITTAPAPEYATVADTNGHQF